jgi:hypothetical protein
MPRKANYIDNPVAKAVERCGGLKRAAKVMGVGRSTIWRWRQAGRITKFSAAVALAHEIEWPIERLASAAR